jgi:hypothetical protein
VGTQFYEKKKKVLFQKILGYRNIKTTLRYTQLLALPQNEDCTCKAAKTVMKAT